MLAAAVGLHHHGAPVGVAQRRLERLGQALARVFPHAQAVHDDVDRVLAVLRKPRRSVELVHRAVDPHAGESLGAKLVEELRLLALAAGDDRREHEQSRLGRQCKRVVDHLRDRLRLQGEPVVGAVGRPGAREKQAQVVVDLGHRADGGARVVARRLLLDRDGGRKALDQVDVGLFHQLQELARVGRERLDVAALALGIERVEGERALARAREPRDDHEAVAREIEADVLEVVRPRAADAKGVHGRDARGRCEAKPVTIACFAFPSHPIHPCPPNA